MGKKKCDPVFRDRLRGLVRAKGFDDSDLIHLGFSESRVSMWWSGWNRPDPDALFKLAEFLEVDARYLRKVQCHLDDLPPHQVAIQESHRLFLEREGPNVDPEERALLEIILRSSPAAQTTTKGWRALWLDVIRPSLEAGRKQRRAAGRLVRARHRER